MAHVVVCSLFYERTDINKVHIVRILKICPWNIAYVEISNVLKMFSLTNNHITSISIAVTITLFNAVKMNSTFICSYSLNMWYGLIEYDC